MGENGSDETETQRTRRGTGVRMPVSDPVVFQRGDLRVEGWALNQSDGGLRAILDEAVEQDGSFDVVVGEDPPRSARVVWVRSEGGGCIVGVSFDDEAGTVPGPEEDLPTSAEVTVPADEGPVPADADPIPEAPEPANPSPGGIHDEESASEPPPSDEA